MFAELVITDVVFADRDAYTVVFGVCCFADVMFVDVMFADVVFADMMFADVVFTDVVCADVIITDVMFKSTGGCSCRSGATWFAVPLVRFAVCLNFSVLTYAGDREDLEYSSGHLLRNRVVRRAG